MKKLFYGCVLFLSIGIIFVSCKKDNLNPQKTILNDNTENDITKIGGPVYNPISVPIKRSYVWRDDKLDCSQDGSGCLVWTLNTNDGDDGDIYVGVENILTLIDLGNSNLDQDFLDGKLIKFSSLYEESIDNKIISGDYHLVFEFPYLFIKNNSNNIVKIINYEETLEFSDVVQKLKSSGGEYDKKAALATEQGSVWKCPEDGSNCKTKSISYNAEWLANNPKYMFAPTNESAVNAIVSRDGSKTTVVQETTSGEKFAIQF